jgi:superfamily II DNA or RNA helicase
VLSLSIEEGRATARVEGRFQPFYEVTIAFSPLPAKDREALFMLIDGDPMLLARIGAGELPMELIEALGKAGIGLLPRAWREMRRSCDCPDSGDPCKHMAAVYYIIAREIDRDPSQLFRLRGVDLAGRYAERETGRGDATAAAAFAEPLPQRLVEAWEPPPAMEGSGLPALAHYGSAIPALLPPPPALVAYDLKTAFVEFYHAVAASWESILTLNKSPPDRLGRLLSGSELFILAEGGDGSSRPSWKILLPPFEGLKRRKLSVIEVVCLFVSFDIEEGTPSYRFLRALSLALRSIVAAGAFVPDLRPSREGAVLLDVVWKPAFFGSDVRELLAVLAELAPPPRLVEGLATKQGKRGAVLVPDAASMVAALAADFLGDFVRELGFMPRAARAAEDPLATALFKGKRVDVSKPALRSLPRALDSWLSVFDIASSAYEYELVVKRGKEARRGAEGSEETGYALEATVRRKGGGEEGKTPAPRQRLSLAAKRLGPRVLAFPALLSSYLPELAALGKRVSVKLDQAALSRLVLDAAPLLSRLGVSVALPKELRTLIRPRLAVKAKRKGMKGLVSFMSEAAMTGFEWQVALGGETMEVAEFERLVKAGGALVRFRDGFLRLSAPEAASILEKLRKKREPDAFDAVKALLEEEDKADDRLGDRLSAFLGRERKRSAKEEAPALPSGLRARLRPYQERGFRWMAENFENGFGCILADDMGLGKTIQAIALVLHLKERALLEGGVLVCCPATLITNWERELARFAPSLSVAAYYGAGRKRVEADLLLTSYETWLRDARRFEDRKWSLVVLDEAHLIKNPDAKRSRAVKAIKSPRRLALSGTPVENHLGELWSIFDFVLPGYLGRLPDFVADFRSPIEVERSIEAAERLKRLTSPFLLRRLKTDRSIIADLPDKVVIDEYAGLTLEQTALYESVVRAHLDRIEAAEGFERLGLVLALITALKQVCNHPRNYDKESPALPERSGKARLLLSLLESALEAGEKVLVFSQYVEMLAILETIIERDLGIRPFVLHGGMTKTRRDAAVDGFQASPLPGVFLVSLKAGGVGLNLTAASRVIHYDLWFNPAVENQATDRAFRIGQTRRVFVHRLITRDSFEEKIDAMIKAKREIAAMTLASGETWISKLGDRELRELVEMR